MQRFRLESGRLTLETDASINVRVRGAGPAVRAWRGGHRIDWVPAQLTASDDGFRADNESEGIALQLRCELCEQGIVLQVTLSNTGPTAIQVSDLAPLQVDTRSGDLVVGAGVDRWSVFRNGYQSWSGTRTYRVHECDRDPSFDFLRVSQVDLRHPSGGRAGMFWSDGFAAIENLRSREALVCGVLDARSAFGGVQLNVEHGVFQELRALSDGDECELDPGASVTSAPFWLAAGPDATALLRAYAHIAGATMKGRIAARGPRGWCSWYYYFQNVREEDVLTNLAALRDVHADVPCDYVMIDDGYQRAVGDWLETNPKFPHGMAWLSEQIRSAGFDAGIWLAPFIARPESRLFVEHSDWFVRTATDQPQAALWNPTWGWKGLAYALDTTHPEALAWLEHVGRTLTATWHYRVLKLDFLFAAALSGRRHDPRATRAQALRRGLEAIRRGAGEDAFLIGCGCPLMPAVGVVDAMRIGPDVAPRWTSWLSRGPMRGLHGVSTKHALRNTLTRSWLHRAWWLNDPDCMMVRDRNTHLTFAEVRTLATIIALTDGLFVMSDRMDTLSLERRGLLRRAMEIAGGTAEVPDLFAGDLPTLLLSRRADHNLLGVFNFRDVTHRTVVDVAPYGLRDGDVMDVWSGARWPVCDGWIDFGELPPHGSMAVRWNL